jgi:hypothetical protein
MRTFALSAVAALAAGPLARLQLTANWFYGDHKANADGLLKQKRIEVEHVVAAKRARARTFTSAPGKRTPKRRVRGGDQHAGGAAEYNIDPNDFGSFGTMYAIAHNCPECGSEERLIGSVDVTHEVEADYYEQVGADDFVAVRGQDYYCIGLIPTAFACNVCKLTLHGQQELAACDLPSSRMDVQDYPLGPDFDPRTAAEAIYGARD